MESQKKLIREGNWDYLLILDACRYDCFEKLYGDYLEGELRKVISPGSNTFEWVKEVFPEKYEDIVYVSANPGINSKTEVKGFYGGNHFPNLIDVWDWGWDREELTVHPRSVNKATLKARNHHSNKRFVVHYMQPHSPYLGLGLGERNEKGLLSELSGCIEKFTGRKAREIVGKNLEKFPRGTRILYAIRELINQRPMLPEEVAFRKGEKALRQKYEENLRIVLRYVAQLVGRLSGKIVVTSDHGERLGEGGRYAHEPHCHVPLLVEVPWLVVEGVKKTEIAPVEFEKENIKDKIRELKQAKKI